MPGTQPALEVVSRPGRRLAPGQFVVTAEHASNDIPARYKNLGLGRRQLQSHIAWDPGSRRIARACSKALGCPCHEGGHSRLLVDLNRSLHHPKLMAVKSFSIGVPGNEQLSRVERDRRVRLYYVPFREAVLADVRKIIQACGRCIHLSVHSFTPLVGKLARNAEIGILYDPSRSVEKTLATELMKPMAKEGLHVRRNYPYRGVSDGHTTHLRTCFAERNYAGLEVEVNQAILRTSSDIRRVARVIAAAVESLTTLR